MNMDPTENMNDQEIFDWLKEMMDITPFFLKAERYYEQAMKLQSDLFRELMAQSEKESYTDYDDMMLRAACLGLKYIYRGEMINDTLYDFLMDPDDYPDDLTEDHYEMEIYYLEKLIDKIEARG